MTSTRIIKKYPNRRLYDTTLGTYITLEEIKQLVFDRVDFKVIDARTKKDLTQITLFQIITEQETGSTPIFTTDMLQDFIRFYQEKSQNLLSQYLQQAMKLFIQQKEFLNTQWKSYEKVLLDPTFIQETLKLQKSFWDSHHPTDSLQKKKSKKKEKEG